MKEPALPGNKPVVAHSVAGWLPLTMTWVYNQVQRMVDFDSMILTNSIQNSEQFPWHSIYCEERALQKIAFKIARKLKMRTYPFIHDSAIKIHKPSILHSHFGDQGWRDLAMAKKHGMAHLVTFYGYDVGMLPTQHPVWKKRYQELFRNADLFLCEGPHMAESLRALGCPEDKVKVQRLGVDLKKIPFAPRTIGKDGVVRILIAGTFREKKGIPYALEAIALLKDTYPTLQVTIVGDSTGLVREESEKRNILDVIRRHELGHITQLLGFQSHEELMKLAYDHHLFLSPSVTSADGDTEGGAPVTIIEMAASGMPVISTTNCDIPFFLGESNRLHLVPERDASSLADKALEFILRMEKKDFGLAHENRAFIERELNILLCSTRLSAIYAALLR